MFEPALQVTHDWRRFFLLVSRYRRISLTESWELYMCSLSADWTQRVPTNHALGVVCPYQRRSKREQFNRRTWVGNANVKWRGNQKALAFYVAVHVHVKLKLSIERLLTDGRPKFIEAVSPLDTCSQYKTGMTARFTFSAAAIRSLSSNSVNVDWDEGYRWKVVMATAWVMRGAGVLIHVYKK